MTQQPLIFATFLAPVLYKTCLYITEYIEQYTGIPTFLLHGESFADFAAGAIDAGFVSGLGYVYLACQQPAPVELIAVPVLQSHGAGGQSSSQVFSDIVVRKKIAFTSVEDMHGCAWASYRKGYREHLSRSTSPDGAFFEPVPFRECIVTDSHFLSLRLLLDGTVDAATVDSHLLDELLHHNPKMGDQLRVIGSFNPATMPPVVISARVASSLRQGIREALLFIHRSSFYAQRLQESSIERFLPVTDEHYRLIRERYRKVQSFCSLC